MILYIATAKDGSLREIAWMARKYCFRIFSTVMTVRKIPFTCYKWTKSSIWTIRTLYLEKENCLLIKGECLF